MQLPDPADPTLIGRNVAELVDLPQGKPGRPSRAMTEEQAGKVLRPRPGR
jgi:hypothetical protein